MNKNTKKFKEGQIVETFNPILLVSGMLIAFALMVYAIYTQQFLCGIGALSFAWQSGWGMRVRRFHEEDKEGKND